MENVYYVMNPTLGLTAVVHAPSTEKARTTFLDWLERNNHIRREDRHSYRRGMVAERLDDPNVPSDVVLHYGYAGEHSLRPTLEGEFEGQPVAKLEPTDVQEYDEFLGIGEPEEKEVITEEAPRPGGMPIQQVMLRGYVE